MGSVVHIGMQTPWGRADYARPLADGIGVVGTPSHGGIKLDDFHNRLVPGFWREANRPPPAKAGGGHQTAGWAGGD